MNRYPQLPHSIEVCTEALGFRRYVLELTVQTSGGERFMQPGRVFREDCARGKAPTFREVKKDGPTWRAVCNSLGVLDASNRVLSDAGLAHVCTFDNYRGETHMGTSVRSCYACQCGATEYR